MHVSRGGPTNGYKGGDGRRAAVTVMVVWWPAVVVAWGQSEDQPGPSSEQGTDRDLKNTPKIVADPTWSECVSEVSLVCQLQNLIVSRMWRGTKSGVRLLISSPVPNMRDTLTQYRIWLGTCQNMRTMSSYGSLSKFQEFIQPQVCITCAIRCISNSPSTIGCFSFENVVLIMMAL